MVEIKFLYFEMEHKHKWYINITQSERLSPSSVQYR